MFSAGCGNWAVRGRVLGGIIPMLSPDEILWRLRLRVLHPRSEWHNRRFPPSLRLNEEGPFTILEYKGLSMRCLRGDACQGTRSGACNLLLSGPSVSTLADPMMLGELPLIGVNGSPELFARVGLGVDYYIVDDLSFIENSLGRYLAYASLAGRVILNHGIAYELLRRGHVLENAVLVDSINAPFRAPAPQRAPAPVVFSRRFGEGLKSYGTVAYVALQAAFCLGFRDVRIFGMDLNSAPRFYPEASAAANHIDRDYEDLILRPMEEVGGMVDRGEWNVVNCSPASRLPDRVLRRCDPNEILGCQTLPAAGRREPGEPQPVVIGAGALAVG